MDEVSNVLNAIDRGEPQAADRLLPLLYDELRRLAAVSLENESASQTLNATALEHKEQADLAMAWLHKAVEAGYDNVEHMKTDADLNALRERDDFKKMLEDLTKAKKSKKE